LILTGDGAGLLRGVSALLLPYYHVVQETEPQARQTTILFYLKRNVKSLQLIQRWQMIQLTLTIHSLGIPLVSNAYMFIFYFRIFVIRTMYIIFMFKTYVLYFFYDRGVLVFIYLESVPLNYITICLIYADFTKNLTPA
jgi:hypothetical protein